MTTDKHIDAPAHTPGRLHIRVWDRLSGEQNAMSKFRKKPVVIEAVQWTGENIEEMINHCAPAGQGEGWQIAPIVRAQPMTIHTLEGDHRADIGDWIIRGVKGELYPCKPDIFEATYELASLAQEG